MRHLTILAAALMLLCACSDNDHPVLPCNLECADFNGTGPVIPVSTSRDDDCRPSFQQQSVLHLCFDDAGTGGGVDCFYDCPDPQP